MVADPTTAGRRRGPFSDVDGGASRRAIRSERNHSDDRFTVIRESHTDHDRRLTEPISQPGLTNDEAPARQDGAVRISHDNLPLSFQGRRQSLAGVYAPTITTDLEWDHGHRLSAALPAVENGLPREVAKLGIERDAFLLPGSDDDRRTDRFVLGASAISGGENDTRDLTTEVTRMLDRLADCYAGPGFVGTDSRC